MRMSIDKQPTTKEPQMAKKTSPTALSPDEIELLFESIALVGKRPGSRSD